MPSALFPELNNLGVDALDNGDYPRAVEFFRHALQSLQNEIGSGWRQKQQQQHEPYQQQQQQHQNILGLHVSPSSTPFLSSLPLEEHRAPPSQLPFVNQVEKNSAIAASRKVAPHEGAQLPPMIYTQGISLLENEQAYQVHFSYNHVEEIRICSSIAMFNLGLTCHLKSLQQHHPKRDAAASASARSTDELRMAKCLYQQVLRHLAAVGLGHNNALLDLIRMAVLNNMARIYLEGMEYLESNRFSAGLVRMAGEVSTTSYSDDVLINQYIHFLLRKETTVFLSNVSPARLLPHNAAPAA
jgi:hypothetical protein